MRQREKEEKEEKEEEVGGGGGGRGKRGRRRRIHYCRDWTQRNRPRAWRQVVPRRRRRS